jgi:hypothetical protein
MAYALNLDPNENLAGKSLVELELTDSYLFMHFRGGAKGVRYIPETSTDLDHWTVGGSTYYRKARVNRDGPRRFMRLKAEEE